MGEKPPGNTCKARADSKGQHLVLGGVDAHGLSRNLIFADSQAGPAVGGVHEVLDEEQGKHREPENPGEIRVMGNALEACGAPHILDIHDDNADDFPQSQSGDSQIVAVEPQGWYANQEPQESR